MALNFDVNRVLLFCLYTVTMRIAMCCFRIKIENQVHTRIFEFDSMVRRENEKSVDSRFLKNVWGIVI
jgi:hypothetical protein